MLALQLARRGVRPLLIDRAAARARGVAYGTSDPAHLLNVAAGRMSAWPEAPDDFAAEAGADPGVFAARWDYGTYLKAQLDAAIEARSVQAVDAQAIAARPVRGTWAVTLDAGATFEAQTLVLATGNGRPAPFAVPGYPEDAILQNPWGVEAETRLTAAASDGAPLVLIGTGLTMVDVVLTLDRLGYSGKVTAVSRRGLTPRAHHLGLAPLRAPNVNEVPRQLSDALAWLRGIGFDTDWRAAVDSVRPISQATWEGWSDAVKARFVRHVRPWWDVHRHRIAPRAAEVVERWQETGKLTVLAGRIVAGSDDCIRIALRGSDRTIEVKASLAVNCTGPSEQLAASANPLLRQMLSDGLIAPGELGLGIMVDQDSRPVLAFGAGVAEAPEDEGGELYAVGPLTKGRWWEISAVPDIRVQVEQMAARIAQGLR